jgi:hypothetical protein
VIHKSPYVVTLGPHGYYWFELKKSKERILVDEPVDFSTVLQVKNGASCSETTKRISLKHKSFRHTSPNGVGLPGCIRELNRSIFMRISG